MVMGAAMAGLAFSLAVRGQTSGTEALEARVLAVESELTSAVLHQTATLSVSDALHEYAVTRGSLPLNEVLCALQPPTRAVPYPSFPRGGPDGEAHAGQGALVLLRTLGPDQVLVSPRLAASVDDIVNGELERPDHYHALEYVLGCTSVGVSVFGHRGPSPVSGCEEPPVAADLDQSWFAELTSLELSHRGTSFCGSWVDQEGHLLTLSSFLDALAVELHREAIRERPYLLAEFGVHAMSALATAARSFEADHCAQASLTRYRAVVDKAVYSLLELVRAESSLGVTERALLAGHLLEFLYSSETYKPVSLDPVCQDLTKPQTGDGLEFYLPALLESLETYLSQSEGGIRPISLISHALAGIRAMRGVPPLTGASRIRAAAPSRSASRCSSASAATPWGRPGATSATRRPEGIGPSSSCPLTSEAPPHPVPVRSPASERGWLFDN